MKNIFAILITASFLVPLHGCATLKNTKIPESFAELGYCQNCKRVMALDGISGDKTCICPNCDENFTANEAKYRFRRRCADLKNQKTAGGVLTVTMMAASVAGAVFGIPIPPPPVSEDTFRPYEMPQIVTCKKAIPVDPPLTQISSSELEPQGPIKMTSPEEPEEVVVENSDDPSPVID